MREGFVCRPALGPDIRARAYSNQAKAAGSRNDILVDAAKKEGKVTVSIPHREMRKQVEEHSKNAMASKSKFSPGAERGGAPHGDEFKAGVRYFDLHIGASSSIVPACSTRAF